MPASFYIRSLQVRKHRHLSLDGTVALGPGLNLLVGRNGTGKTTLLQLIRELSQGSPDSKLGTWLGDDDVVNRLVIARPESETSVEAWKSTKHWSGWETLRERVRFVTSDRQLSNVAQIRSFLPKLTEYQIAEPSQDLNVAEEFTKAIVAELIERLEGLGEGLAKVTTELEADYRRALVDFGKDIRLDFSRDNFVYFLDHNDEEVPIDALSSGEKEYLYFYSYLRRIRGDANKIILIDEPELHLHSTQVMQICKMLTSLADRNQVIAATHSPEVLQHFLPAGTIILLGEGRITNVTVPADMRRLVEQLGLPLDPSVFTATWVVAENKTSTPLPGPEAPDTEEVLAWMLGSSLERRYWAFGSSRSSVEGADQFLTMVTGDQGDMDVSVVLDGDRLCKSSDAFPPSEAELNSTGGPVFYLPCWEIENLFLSTQLLEALPNPTQEPMVDRLWRLVVTNRDRLIHSVEKTITKNAIRELKSDRLTAQGSPAEGLAQYKQAVANLTIDAKSVADVFDSLVATRDWAWLPGKEALGFLVGDLSSFWVSVRALPEDERRELLQAALGESPVLGLSLAQGG